MNQDMVPTMIASALTGAIVRIPCHPIDTIKARIMSDTKSNPIDKTNIYKGLYRGFGITFFGSIPASCLYFSTYEISKHYLSEGSKTISFLKIPDSLSHFIAGLIAETVSCVLWVPIDVVKERMQVQKPLNVIESTASSSSSSNANSSYKYKNSIHALNNIVKNDGIVKGLYSGYGATVLSFGPYSALYFAFYEYLRSLAASRYKEIPFTIFLLCGGCAGAGAALLTNSLDLVKLRMQVKNEVGSQTRSKFLYRNLFQGVYEVYKQEGIVNGLFRGATARVAFSAPSAALSIAFFEILKSHISQGY